MIFLSYQPYFARNLVSRAIFRPFPALTRQCAPFRREKTLAKYLRLCYTNRVSKIMQV